MWESGEQAQWTPRRHLHAVGYATGSSSSPPRGTCLASRCIKPASRWPTRRSAGTRARESVSRLRLRSTRSTTEAGDIRRAQKKKSVLEQRGPLGARRHLLPASAFRRTGRFGRTAGAGRGMRAAWRSGRRAARRSDGSRRGRARGRGGIEARAGSAERAVADQLRQQARDPSARDAATAGGQFRQDRARRERRGTSPHHIEHEGPERRSGRCGTGADRPWGRRGGGTGWANRSAGEQSLRPFERGDLLLDLSDLPTFLLE
jgi:hypothetical protein